MAHGAAFQAGLIEFVIEANYGLISAYLDGRAATIRRHFSAGGRSKKISRGPTSFSTFHVFGKLIILST